MSIESAKAYLKRLKIDRTFRDRVGATKNREARSALVEAEGLSFSSEDLDAVTDELTIKELEMMAGGLNRCTRSIEHDATGLG